MKALILFPHRTSHFHRQHLVFGNPSECRNEMDGPQRLFIHEAYIDIVDYIKAIAMTKLNWL